MYHLYILKSTIKNYSYVGVTNDLKRRLIEHNNGKNKSTASYRPFLLKYSEKYEILSETRKREWFLKCTPQGGKFKKKILAMAGVAAHRA